jgi:hypothetical protein
LKKDFSITKDITPNEQLSLDIIAATKGYEYIKATCTGNFLVDPQLI